MIRYIQAVKPNMYACHGNTVSAKNTFSEKLKDQAGFMFFFSNKDIHFLWSFAERECVSEWKNM